MEVDSFIMRSPDRRVLGVINNNTYSPTANLHLLTSVASELSDMAEREEALQSQSKGSNGRRAGFKPRKDKSLGILCDKFLAMFPIKLDETCSSIEINLDKVSMELGIVKRRIYDIINILESLHMTSRVAKNRYEWYGDRNLRAALSHLRKLALKYGWEQKIQEFKQQQQSVQQSKCTNSSVTCSIECFDACEKNIGTSQQNSDDFLHEERTLGIMCQKFIMLFLVTEEGEMVNLDLATQMLVNTPVRPSLSEPAFSDKPIHQACCHPRLKTKIRRLYDIANVLISLGLIRKEWLTVSTFRKHGFVYSGPIVEDWTESFKYDATSLHTMRNSLLMVPIEQGRDLAASYGQNRRINRKRKDEFWNGPMEKLQCVSGGDSSEAIRTPTRLGSLEDILRVAEQELKLLSQEANSESPAIQGESDPPDKKECPDNHDHSISRPICVVEALSVHNYAAALPTHLQDDCPAQSVTVEDSAEDSVEDSAEESPNESDSKTEISTIIPKDELSSAVTPFPESVSACRPGDAEVRLTVTRTLAPSNVIVRKLNPTDLKVTIHHTRDGTGSFIRLQPVGSSQKLSLPVTCIQSLKATNISILKAPLNMSGALGVTHNIESKKTVRVIPIRSNDACP